MNNFTFYSPTLFAFGQGEASRVGSLVRQFGGSKVLLVAGGGSVKKNGAYDAVAASLKEAGLPWCELWGVQANPRSGKVAIYSLPSPRGSRIPKRKSFPLSG